MSVMNYGMGGGRGSGVRRKIAWSGGKGGRVGQKGI